MDRTVISRKDVVKENAVLGPGQSKLTEDDYADRLVKYIPPDVIGAFVSLEGLVASSNSPSKETVGWIIFVVILLASPFYLIRIGKVRKGVQVILSTVAFLVWAFAYPGPPFEFLHVDSLYRSVVLALYTFLIPLFAV